MKIILFLILVSTLSFAGEVDTDCPAKNDSREKITKDSSARQRKGSSKVVNQ